MVPERFHVTVYRRRIFLPFARVDDVNLDVDVLGVRNKKGFGSTVRWPVSIRNALRFSVPHGLHPTYS